MRRRREQLVNQRTQDKNRLAFVQSAGVRASAERHIAWLDDELAHLNKEPQALLNDRPALAGLAVLHRSAPGIRVLTAATLVVKLSEPGQNDSKSLAARAGMAPWGRDSGQQQGKRSPRGRRSAARRILYLVALSASRYHSGLREFYQRSLPLGKVGKVRWWQ